jgi:hypothetical protein
MPPRALLSDLESSAHPLDEPGRDDTRVRPVEGTKRFECHVRITEGGQSASSRAQPLIFHTVIGTQWVLDHTQDGANFLDILPGLVDRVLIGRRPV